MAQTKHRSVKIDRNDTRFDEEEQKMHVKEYRKNKMINNKPEYLEDLDDCPYQDDIEYLLRKNR